MGILDIEGFSKSFKVKGKELCVLNNVNLSINKGDIFGVIGLSGEGKSTLVRCINGLEKSSEGSIIYDDHGNKIVLNQLSETEMVKYREKIAMIFQNFNLFKQRTVLDNVLFPMRLGKNTVSKQEMRDKALDLINLVGLSEKINSYPSQLSGGQQQRVAIARALASDPEILLCDECTSALDPTTANQILDLLKSLKESRGLTVVIIAHQMSVIERICNRVAIIANHEIVEQGDVSTVFLNPRTKESRELIYSGHINTKLHESNLLRILFEGDPDIPLITNIVQDCNILVSVVYANSWVSEKRVYGQLIIKLPYYDEDIQKLKKYLDFKKVKYEEVSIDDLENNH